MLIESHLVLETGVTFYLDLRQGLPKVSLLINEILLTFTFYKYLKGND